MGSILPITEGNDDLVYINEHLSVSKQLLSDIANKLQEKEIALIARKFYLEGLSIKEISSDLGFNISEMIIVLQKLRIIMLSTVCRAIKINRNSL